ncbi:hypothetical protein CCMA1212_003198 [Trichoderma ghanense]|uniref:Uncharacterized protein n=1 Tax=Trichoderma ghanense TaxID=65468 RepID=A0ABY2H9J9_9HYPO
MDTTPLLDNRPALIRDHPVFLRASHSPWSLIPQNVLSFVRGSILAYLTVAAALILNYELTNPPPNQNPTDPGAPDPDGPGSSDPNDPSLSTLASTATNWRLLFEFPIISFGLVLWYFVVTFSWTFTHLYYPDADDIDGRVQYAIIRLMSLPRDLGNARYQFYFTLFYFTTVAYAFMNSAIYWFVTRPHDLVHVVTGLFTQYPDEVKLWDATAVTLARPFNDIFGEGWLRAFTLINLYAVTPVIMAIEVLFLNSIRRPNGIGGYLFALLVSAALYIGWAFIGHAATDVWPFFFLDAAQVGSTGAVVAYSIGFVLLAPIALVFMQGFVGVRESLLRPTSLSRTLLGPRRTADGGVLTQQSS